MFKVGDKVKVKNPFCMYKEGGEIVKIKKEKRFKVCFDDGNTNYYSAEELELKKSSAFKKGDYVDVKPSGYHFFDGKGHYVVESDSIENYSVHVKEIETGKLQYVRQEDLTKCNKFKVGDHIIAKNFTPYLITTHGWKGEVTFVDCITGHINAGRFDYLDPDYFDLDLNYCKIEALKKEIAEKQRELSRLMKKL